VDCGGSGVGGTDTCTVPRNSAASSAVTAYVDLMQQIR
jgi:hypothetical protein